MTPEEDLKRTIINGHSNLRETDDLSQKNDEYSGKLSVSAKDIEALVEQITNPILEYFKLKSEEQDRANERSSQEDLEKLKLIDKLDTKDKLFKGVLIVVCITALLLVTALIEDSEGVTPVLSLIMGLLFKNSSLSDFFSFHKDKTTNEKKM